MKGRVVLQLRFAQVAGEALPVAASLKQGGAGARVTLEVEREALQAGAVHVLYRQGGAPVVVAGSVDRARVEVALQGLGPAASAYRIAAIPVSRSSSSAY